MLGSRVFPACPAASVKEFRHLRDLGWDSVYWLELDSFEHSVDDLKQRLDRRENNMLPRIHFFLEFLSSSNPQLIYQEKHFLTFAFTVSENWKCFATNATCPFKIAFKQNSGQITYKLIPRQTAKE